MGIWFLGVINQFHKITEGDSGVSSVFLKTTMNRAISFKNIFSNKWILYNSKVVSTATLQGGSVNDYDMYLFEKHIFYKVSSD